MQKSSWIANVDAIMRRDWCIDTADAGLDDAQLTEFWASGDSPEAFVSWFAEKYDLIPYNGPDYLASSSAQPLKRDSR